MVPVIVLIFLVMVLVRARTRTRTRRNLSYDCFLLTVNDQTERRNRFFKGHDSSIPIETIYGMDTRKVKNARVYENLIDPAYFEKAIEMHYDPTIIRPDITYFNIGAIGCFMGHMDFYKRCFERTGLKYAVIFEDNVIIKNHGIYDEIQSVIDEKGDAFEMCFFHCLARLSEPGNNGLEKVKWISSTKCYLIHVDNMRNYVQYFLPMDNHVDMKHEDLVRNGARIFYKDLRNCIQIDRNQMSLINHSKHGRPDFISRYYSSDTIKNGY
jgi:hypothetical protein